MNAHISYACPKEVLYSPDYACKFSLDAGHSLTFGAWQVLLAPSNERVAFSGSCISRLHIAGEPRAWSLISLNQALVNTQEMQ